MSLFIHGDITPIKVIVFLLVTCFCGCIGAIAGIAATDTKDYYKQVKTYPWIGVLAGIAWFLFLTWIMVGPKTFIGSWLLNN